MNRVVGAVLLVAGASGCSNMLVSKGATADGSTQIAYNSDGQVCVLYIYCTI